MAKYIVAVHHMQMIEMEANNSNEAIRKVHDSIEPREADSCTYSIVKETRADDDGTYKTIDAIV